MKRMLIVILAAFAAAACSSHAPAVRWYTDIREEGAAADVFYVVSTNVAGSDVERLAFLTEEEMALMQKEFEYVDRTFGEDFNIFAPFYHQYTLSTISLSPEEFMPLRKTALEEVYAAFCEYYDGMRGDRDFILAGFSQGAMHVVDMLKMMSDEQYSHCIAAYSLGYRLSEEDLADPHITAAADETSRGVTVSFNSVADTSAIWPAITSGAATCINPVNWCTDATPAGIVIGGYEATVRVDTSSYVLVVEGIDPSAYAVPSLEEYCNPGNLHIGDLLFYADRIAENARLRAGLKPSLP